ncbi:MAG TPA: DUF2510 domain-containing protein [Acidimicrobiales bacterium]|nr:DUF2510 domain-containing protein [Acidimicrobiales bacterium]
MTQAAVPPGWYPVAQDSAMLRWWDGAQWTSHRRPVAEESADAAAPGTDDCLEEATRAISRAQDSDTARSWREAVQAELAVLAMVQTRLMAAEARETAAHKARAMELASDAATEATLIAEAADEATRMAELAADVLRRVGRAADESARAAQTSAHAALVAAKASAAATIKAHDLELVVERARDAGTHAAWGEALKVAAGDEEVEGIEARSAGTAPVVEEDLVSADTPALRSVEPAGGLEVDDGSETVRRLHELHSAGKLSDSELEAMSKDILGPTA